MMVIVCSSVSLVLDWLLFVGHVARWVVQGSVILFWSDEGIIFGDTGEFMYWSIWLRVVF